jgi:hypothetical protein
MKAVNVLFLGVAISLGAGACSPGSAPPSTSSTPAPAAPAPSPMAPPVNTIVTQISDPDEALKALTNVKPEEWKTYIDAGTSVSGNDRPKVAVAIGMQSANAVVAAYAGDDPTADKLATSIKGLTERLSVKSAELEKLVAKTATDLKEPDAAKRSAAVRADLVQMQDEVKATLDKLGDGAVANLMLFGAWIEGVRITSAAVKAKYDATASDVLNRRSEADYFLSSFAAAPGGDPLYGQITPALRRVREGMAANASHQISAASVGEINAAATELSALLRK